MIKKVHEKLMKQVEELSAPSKYHDAISEIKAGTFNPDSVDDNGELILFKLARLGKLPKSCPKKYLIHISDTKIDWTHTSLKHPSLLAMIILINLLEYVNVDEEVLTTYDPDIGMTPLHMLAAKGTWMSGLSDEAYELRIQKGKSEGMSVKELYDFYVETINDNEGDN